MSHTQIDPTRVRAYTAELVSTRFMMNGIVFVGECDCGDVTIVAHDSENRVCPSCGAAVKMEMFSNREQVAAFVADQLAGETLH